MMVISACASIHSLGFKEPKVVILRNNLGTDLNRIEILEVKKRAGEGARFASISPVPKGASQILVRGSSPATLPEVDEVRWIDTRGMELNKQVSLKQVLMQSAERSGDTLVLEILQSNDVQVYFEHQ